MLQSSHGNPAMYRILFLSLLTCLSLSAYGETLGMESDWLELVKGERCPNSGAEIMGVSKDADTGHHTVLVKLPKSVVSDDPMLEEVRVVAQAPEKMKMPELFPELETEWVDDYDNDHYGLLVKLKSDQRVPIRLFLSSSSGFLDGSVKP